MLDEIIRLLRSADDRQLEYLYFFIKGFLSRKH